MDARPRRSPPPARDASDTAPSPGSPPTPWWRRRTAPIAALRVLGASAVLGLTLGACAAPPADTEAVDAGASPLAVTPAVQTALDCVRDGYAAAGTCDWPHWSEMNDRCALGAQPQLRDHLLHELDAGLCTSERWPAFVEYVGRDDVTPIATFSDAAFVRAGGARPAVAKDVIPGYPKIHAAAYVNDGYYGNGASWISNSAFSWIKIDLGRPMLIDGVRFGRDRMGRYDDRSPGGFYVYAAAADEQYADGNGSNDDLEYTQVYSSWDHAFSGAIPRAATVRVSFAPVVARFVKLQVERAGTAIDELEVSRALSTVVASAATGVDGCEPPYAPPQCNTRAFATANDLAYAPSGSPVRAVAKDTIPGYAPIHAPAYVNDGKYGNGSSWISNSPSSWIKIDLGKPTLLNEVRFGRDRTGGYDERDPGQFVVQAALADNRFADGDESLDADEYRSVFDSADGGFNGAVAGPSTVRAKFSPIVARFVKVSVANAGAAIDELEAFFASGLEDDGVATRIDLKQDGKCLTGSAVGACTSPRWVLEPTVTHDTYRLRSGDSPGSCLELLPTRPARVLTMACRGRSDPAYANQIWYFPVGADAKQLIRSASAASSCLATNQGSIVTATCAPDAPPAAQLWQIAAAVHPEEHWRRINEYVDTGSTPDRYSYSFLTNGSGLTEQGVFVALEEPAADTVAVYRNSEGRLSTCDDESPDCGRDPLAFYTPRAPRDASDTSRVPVYEFHTTATDVPRRYRYSTRSYVVDYTHEDGGYGYAREPGVAFYAYANQGATGARVSEMLTTVTDLASEAGVTIPALVSDTTRDGSAGYELVDGRVLVHSSGVELPDREELVHVLGHVMVDAMLGSADEDDQCVFTPDAALARSDYHRPRDLLDPEWQANPCLLREGWVEYFTSQILLGHGELHDFHGAGLDGMAHNPRRRLFVSPPTILLGLLGTYAAILVMEDMMLKQSRGPDDMVTVALAGFKATVSSMTGMGRDHTTEDYARTKPSAKDAVCKALANVPPPWVPPNVMDFKAALIDDPLSQCQVITPNDEWTFKSCRTPVRILCSTGSSTFAATPKSYAPYDAVEACILAFGADSKPIRSAQKRTRAEVGAPTTGDLGTGEALDCAKKLRIMPVSSESQVGSVTALKAKLEGDPDYPKYNHLLVHSLNVGAGSCHIVQCVGDKSVFVDCGSAGSNRPVLNAPAVLAYAKEMGILEDESRPAIVVTHPHKDHWGHLRGVFVDRAPERVWLGGANPAFTTKYGPVFVSWMDTLRGAGVLVNDSSAISQPWPAASRHIQTFAKCGNASLDMVTVNVTSAVGPQELNANRSSAVLQLTLPNKLAAFFTGDALGETEDAARAQLDLQHFPDARANYGIMRFLTASHHGSSGGAGYISNTDDWIRYIQPTHAVYSAGSRYRHPKCAVKARFEAGALLQAAPAHDIECGTDDPPRRVIEPSSKRHYSTRSSGSIIAGIAIPRANETVVDKAVFVTER
jgi:beta-lactamase superfamily II metal-dependent hydrolase